MKKRKTDNTSFSFGHCIVCLSLFHLAIVLSVFLFFIWPLYCLSFSKDRQYNSQMKKRKTDNTIAKWKRERQTIQWPNEKEKDRQYNSQMKKRKTDNTIASLSFFFSFGYCIVCLSLIHLALYCLSFSFSFGHCIVCLSLFHLAIVLSVFLFFIWLRQTIQSQMKKRKTDNTITKWKRERQTIQ
jgi:flagellar biogenesis protein FliO